jgi:hypothetical protein
MQTHLVGVQLKQAAMMERHTKMLFATYANVPNEGKNVKTVNHRTKWLNNLHNTYSNTHKCERLHKALSS